LNEEGTFVEAAGGEAPAFPVGRELGNL